MYRILTEPYNVGKKTKKGITVVWDLDGTLITTNKDKHFLRPFALYCIEKLYKQNIEMILWSAGSQEHVENALGLLFSDKTYFDACVVRGSWFTGRCCAKNLTFLVNDTRSLDEIVIIENSIFSVQMQHENAIIVDSFSGASRIDNTFMHLANFLLALNNQFELNVISNIYDYISTSDKMTYIEHVTESLSTRLHGEFKWFYFNYNKVPYENLITINESVLLLETLELNEDIINSDQGINKKSDEPHKNIGSSFSGSFDDLSSLVRMDAQMSMPCYSDSLETINISCA